MCLQCDFIVDELVPQLLQTLGSEVVSNVLENKFHAFLNFKRSS